MLNRIIYSSAANSPMGRAELEVILDDARTGNERHEVTGALVYADGIFLQVLEGEEGVLARLVASIENDCRHHSMKVFHQEGIEQRLFGEWRMAYLAANPAEMARWTDLKGTVTIERLVEQVHDDKRQVPTILVHIVEAIAESSR